MGAQELSAVLWRERELLDLLVFKLEVEQLLLVAGKSRWLHLATQEVELVLDRVKTAEFERAIEVSAAADEWGVGGDPTLRQLVENAPEGAWRDTFAAHLAALQKLAEQIAALRDANEGIVRSSLRAVQDAMVDGDDGGSVYTASGAPVAAETHARIVDLTA